MAKTLNNVFKISFVCLFLYQLTFIFHLEISHFDSYSYAVAAKVNAGFRYYLEPEDNNRPPLLPFLLTPLALLHHLGVANKTIFTLQHLFALPIAYAFILASYYFFRRTLREEYASLGALLILMQPGFLTYAFEPMVDLPSALVLTLSIIFYFRYRSVPSRKNLIAICLITGVGISLKNSLVVAPFIFSCAEIIIMVHEGKKWQDLCKNRFIYIVPALSLGVYAVVNNVANVPLHGWTWHNLSRIYMPLLSRVAINAPMQLNLPANFSFLEVQMTLPWFWLMIAGLFFCLRKRSADTLTVWAWFVVYLFFITVINHMYQYRLLFPVMPACYFFSLTALQAFDDKAMKQWGRNYQRWRFVAVAALLILPVLGMAQRIEFLNGRIFKDNFEQRVAERARQLAGNTSKIYWFGFHYGIHQKGQPMHPDDDFYDIYHFGCIAVSMFTDRPCYSFNHFPYWLSPFFKNNPVVIYNSTPYYVWNQTVSETRGLPPLMAGNIYRHVFVLADHKDQVKIFSGAGGKTRLILTAGDQPKVSIKIEGEDSYALTLFLWLKTKLSDGVDEDLEESMAFFEREKSREFWLEADKNYFDRIEEITLFDYRAEKFFPPGHD